MSNIKISEMTEATSLGDSDLLTIVQGGINKKITKTNAIGDMITALNNPTYTTDTGTSLNLNNTRVGRLKTTLKGDTQQFTTTGKNLLDESTLRQGSGYDTTSTTRVFIPGNYYLETGTYTLYTNINTTNFKYAIGIGANAYPNVGSYIYDSRLANEQ